MSVKRLCYLVMLTAVLFVQEEVLTFIPSVQLTFFLIILYGATVGIRDGSIIVIIHVLLDNLYMSSFGIYTIGPMLVGYEITLVVGYLFKNKSEWLIAIMSGVCALIYAGLFIPVNIFVYDVDPIAYIIADIPFDLVMVTCNICCVLFLYKPLYSILDNELNKKEIEEIEEDNKDRD